MPSNRSPWPRAFWSEATDPAAAFPRRPRASIPRIVAAVAVLCVGLGAEPARAQDDDPTSPTTDPSTPTTDTTTTSSTVAPTTTVGDATSTTTTTTTIDPADPTAGEEAPPETAPEIDATVPSAGPFSGPPSRALRLSSTEAAAAARDSDAAVAAATERVEELTANLGELERRLARIDVTHAQVVDDLLAAETTFEDRIAAAVVRGNGAELVLLVSVGDVVELQTANVLLRSVTEGDVAAITAYVAARDLLEDGLLQVVDAVADLHRQLREARDTLRSAVATHSLMRYRLAVVSSGSDIVIDGFVFPVGQPFDFIDSWGFPRMVGTEYAHGHQGVDIMAPFGTPLFACERGIITRVGADTLGGIKLWVRGESGTDYYYAHLQSYADGIGPGAVVEAGQVVGYVGDTGNAQGGAPHLHFQLHPGGGAPVNPYALLRTVADL